MTCMKWNDMPWMNERMNEVKNMKEWLTDWLTAWVNEWTNEWMNEWMNWHERIARKELGWMNLHKRIDMNGLNWLGLKWSELNWSQRIVWLKKWNEMKRNDMKWMMWLTWWWFCRPHLPKVIPDAHFLTCSKMQIKLSKQSLAHFAGLIFQTCSEALSVLTFSCGNRALDIVLGPVSFLSATFPNRAASATTAATLPEKQMVWRPGVFSSLNSRVHDVVHFPTTWRWCGCHDFEKTSHDNRP